MKLSSLLPNANLLLLLLTDKILNNNNYITFFVLLFFFNTGVFSCFQWVDLASLFWVELYIYLFQSFTTSCARALALCRLFGARVLECIAKRVNCRTWVSILPSSPSPPPSPHHSPLLSYSTITGLQCRIEFSVSIVAAGIAPLALGGLHYSNLVLGGVLEND